MRKALASCAPPTSGNGQAPLWMRKPPRCVTPSITSTTLTCGISLRSGAVAVSSHPGSWILPRPLCGDDPMLSKFAGRISDSGEGRWTIKAAIDEAAPVPVLTSALYERFSSRGEADFANKLLSAMRYQFGGHLEKAGQKPRVA